MKRFIRNTLILLTPFLIMILINEAVRPKIKEPPYTVWGITAMNSVENLPDKCTWACHNNTTSHCKIHHVKYLKPFYPVTDIFYFGAISMLKSTGSYVGANIIFFVILFPLMILIFIIKSLNIQDKIRELKK